VNQTLAARTLTEPVEMSKLQGKSETYRTAGGGAAGGGCTN